MPLTAFTHTSRTTRAASCALPDCVISFIKNVQRISPDGYPSMRKEASGLGGHLFKLFSALSAHLTVFKSYFSQQLTVAKAA